MTVYPNPTNGHFTVDVNLGEAIDATARVTVVNMIGQTVIADYAGVTNGHLAHELMLTNELPAGMYLVRVMVNNTVFNAQIVYQQ
jgi:hypothetical protein